MAKSAAALALDTIDDDNVLDRPERPPETSTDAAEDSGGPARRRGGGLILAAVVFLGAIVLAGSVWGVRSWSDWRTTDAAAARDVSILDTATQMSTNLVTLRHQSVDEDIKKVADGTTGPFHDQFATSSGGFGDVLNQGQVESTGEVKSAGIIDSSDDHATVLAAVTSTVKNTEAPDGEMRVYRMKLTLDLVDGRWLVSDVEFVA
ncbi:MULTISPECIES: hypothetical protein [Rhodococcus]|uniref:Hypothetical membrane protein n=2 Tax=Rhodococcus opacus TaxID=37919 RepID=C1BDE7_RHOOB|nr:MULTISPECIES: hypothetical protein [Rhodococcus]EID79024.1 putative membrane protein [Rhodococcus opacus RKJ300 = JCM 13270]KAF0960424.1 hypothetical protein MLGJGCBP_06439 [Rhodococcus sp. T7]QQZ18278.1 hypothetical protein GO592_39330 [Rhodococcus sp. 21391]UOT08218.1 hypothetical protein MPY17_38445 [Rhodococcus opacus]BAH55891.1 hypothetical membrane protein [Rhodococcus opacus B4]